jgi:sugar (pentulose or hexulose) kinase
MKSIPVILIFDVGKTNKKVLLFDKQYRIIWEHATQFEETTDEDGFPCENLKTLTEWLKTSFTVLLNDKRFQITAVNVTAYGASFVYLQENLRSSLPLYNYLKPYPQELLNKFYNTYGGKEQFAARTASPVLGSLNSGMQLYRIKEEKPEVFKKIRHALHLPQYLSSLLTEKYCSEITSIGCHTNLWDFTTMNYHEWVEKESVLRLLPPIIKSNESFSLDIAGNQICAGPGLHDSSAALIPYLTNFSEPFVLISSGTWSISLNPFNTTRLTQQELEQDCLCYLTYQGKPTKASRIFAGHEHEEKSKKLAIRFNKPESYFATLPFNVNYGKRLMQGYEERFFQSTSISDDIFSMYELYGFSSAEEAYHALVFDIVHKQWASTHLILKNTDVKRLFVDGGFSKNAIYMHFLAAVFPELEVYAASVAHATAIGAALAIHDRWNDQPPSADLIELRYYKNTLKRYDIDA